MAFFWVSRFVVGSGYNSPKCEALRLLGDLSDAIWLAVPRHGAVLRLCIPSRGGTQAWISVVFWLFFTCIGLGLISASIVGSRISKQQEEVKAADPDKPWV
jgi:hypothetical protein